MLSPFRFKPGRAGDGGFLAVCCGVWPRGQRVLSRAGAGVQAGTVSELWVGVRGGCVVLSLRVLGLDWTHRETGLVYASFLFYLMRSSLNVVI